MNVSTEERGRLIIRYSIVGMIVNLVLAAAKIIIGNSIHAQMIVLDGINSLSDCLSSILSIFPYHWGKSMETKSILWGTAGSNTCFPC